MTQHELHELRSRLNAHSKRIRVLQYIAAAQTAAILAITVAVVIRP